jgi:predicted nucleotidyltransferase
MPRARSTLAKDSLLDEIVRRLVRTYAPENVYLFGSTARGDAGPDSDYDILVVVADATPPDRRQARAGYEALWGLKRSGDILVCTRGQFDDRVSIPWSIPEAVTREGVVLYAA